MRTVFLVTYDISDPKRLRRVFDTLKGFGDHLQFSVFWCPLSKSELIQLRAGLRDVIHRSEDQVLLIRLGPEGDRTAARLQALGRGYSPPSRGPTIV